MKQKVFFVIFFCIFLTLSTSACGSENSGSVLHCPFTDMDWNSSVDDMIAAEGDQFSTYDSVYGGICYTWPKEYNGLLGTVKYMFDDEERLMCVAWAYGCENAEELYALYESISASVNEIYGESSYAADNPGNYGNVWYLDTGDIVLTTMVTSENKALQYAYLHPLVSNQTLP